MLHYCSSGIRNYHKNPVKIHQRHYWEFQLFTKGQSCPVFIDNRKLIVPDNFWIFSPHCPHGWQSDQNTDCEVAVFHFSEIPETLRHVLRHSEYINISLPNKVLNELKLMTQALAPEVIKPDAMSPLRFRFCLDRLSLTFLEEYSRHNELDLPSREKMIADAALAWLGSHMEECPEIQDLAEKMGYCVSHLRRIFKGALGMSPLEAYTKKRMVRAIELLKTGDISIIEISIACGYSSHSTFTRAFKNFFGISPSQYQVSLLKDSSL